jgi:Na+/melibiose symporter-like transporter
MNLHKESDRLWTRSFISLTISAFLLFLNLQMLLSSLSSYAKNDLAASDLEVSLVTSVFAVSAILARFLTAAMLRKFSPNVLLFTGLIIAALMD